MNARGISKAGILPVIAAMVLFAVPNGFAADQPSKSGGNVKLKAKPAAQENLNIKGLDEQVSHLEVVDSNGSAYLLIPLQTSTGNKPVIAQDGKIIVEYVHPYMEPMSR